MDPLTDVLRSLRLTGGVFLDVSLTAPWSVLSHIEADDISSFLTAPKNMISYHCVTEGRLQISVDGERPVEVRAGEIVLLPRNDVHTLASEAGITPVDGRQLVQPAADGGLARVAHGGGGTATKLVCGFLGSEGHYNPLIASLPRLMKLDVMESASRDWVEASVRFAAGELVRGKPASSETMSRLSELLLIEAVRGYLSTQDIAEAGWLKGLSDPQVGKALALIHQDTRRQWSTGALASDVAMSRSAFVDRFTTLVGMPPIRYLTLWRLQTAKLNLAETHMSMAQLAHSVGYESEEAFSRAFKREFGLAPGKWRERKTQGEPPQI